MWPPGQRVRPGNGRPGATLSAFIVIPEHIGDLPAPGDQGAQGHTAGRQLLSGTHFWTLAEFMAD
jgi:hypothetical protein